MEKLSAKVMLSILCVTLLGCQQSPIADRVICAPTDASKFLGPDKGPKDIHQQREYADLCVRRHAYRLAVAEGSVAEIAQAAVKSCESTINDIVSKRVPIEKEVRPLQERWDEQSFEREEMMEDARLYVVQSRAGNCHLDLKAEAK